jgi:hypothetical protein
MSQLLDRHRVSELGRLFAVDETGYVLISTAADCRIASHRMTVGPTRVALPSTPLPGRRRIYVNNNQKFNNPPTREGHPLLYIGGADVTAGTGFAIPAGDELLLEVSKDILLFGLTDLGETVDTGVLELA